MIDHAEREIPKVKRWDGILTIYCVIVISTEPMLSKLFISERRRVMARAIKHNIPEGRTLHSL
jgi:hypothetical protein